MRLSSALAIPLLLLRTVNAFGDRAAAERALAYLGYLMEEAYDSAESYQIAKGCKPVSGVGRCSFIEFCDHIWANRPDELDNSGNVKKHYSDVKPDLSIPKTFARGYDVNTIATKDLNAYILTHALMKMTEKGKGASNPKFGYVGAEDSFKLIEESDYYKSMPKLGKAINAAAVECNKPEKSGTYGHLVAKVSDAVKLCTDLRQKDWAKFALDKGANTLQDNLEGKATVERSPYSPLSGMAARKEDTFKLWNTPDRDLTIASIETADGVDKTTAQGKYDAAIDQMEAGGANGKQKATMDAHRNAIDAIRGCADEIAKPPVSC